MGEGNIGKRFEGMHIHKSVACAYLWNGVIRPVEVVDL